MYKIKLILTTFIMLVLTGCSTNIDRGPQELLDLKDKEGKYVYDYFFNNNGFSNSLVATFTDTFELIGYTLAIASLLVTGASFIINRDEKSAHNLKISVIITVIAFLILRLLPSIIKWLIVR